MYKDLSPFQIIDLSVLNKNKKTYRGKRKILYKQHDKEMILTNKIKPAEKLSKTQKDIAKFYFQQPGLIKKIIRKEPIQVIRKAFDLKLINQIKPFCFEQNLKTINEALENKNWKKAFAEGLKLFDEKTKKNQPKNNNFCRLKNRVKVLSKLI